MSGCLYWLPVLLYMAKLILFGENCNISGNFIARQNGVFCRSFLPLQQHLHHQLLAFARHWQVQALFAVFCHGAARYVVAAGI